MIKLNFYLIASILILISCNQSEKSKKISARDYSIDAGNSYSDIFLDSLTVQSFADSLQTEDKIKRRIISFYNARNYQFAWFSSEGLQEQARGFWNLYQYHVKHGEDSLYHEKQMILKMERLFATTEVNISASKKSYVETELQLTRLFIEHTLEVYDNGFVKRKEMERFIPLKKADALVLADSLLMKKHNDDRYYEDVNEAYGKLKEQLGKYVAVAKAGGWQPIVTSEKQLKVGMQNPAIPILKKRLAATGQLSNPDSTLNFDAPLEGAVKKFQSSLGLTQDGIVTQPLLAELNIPVEERVKQILINLSRMRWMPVKPKGELMLVNIPEFILHVFDGEKKVFVMAVVVGKEAHSTMMFTDELNQVVFSPYWNIPPSIVKNEILPGIARNPDYLAKHNMEMVSQGSVPEIRQLPGAGNSLGKVKFLFPNSFNIYFHDTPAKSLFSKDKRAYSHGCIRLSDPAKLANYVLRNDKDWTPEKINAAMNSSKEQVVRLPKAIPVFITYYTSWVDESGMLNFRDDIYGHDKKVADKMFEK